MNDGLDDVRLPWRLGRGHDAPWRPTWSEGPHSTEVSGSITHARSNARVYGRCHENRAGVAACETFSSKVIAASRPYV
jgi:hypothetical protein